MTTKPNPVSDPIPPKADAIAGSDEEPTLWTDDEAAQKLVALAAAEQEYLDSFETFDRLRQEVLQQIGLRGGTEIPSDTFLCRVEVTNTYDQSKLVPFKEKLTQTEFDHAWEPPWTETRTINHEGKFNTTKLKAIAERRGDDDKAAFYRAQIPGAPKLKFERRG